VIPGSITPVQIEAKDRGIKAKQFRLVFLVTKAHKILLERREEGKIHSQSISQIRLQ
jgi:hypothetical protein